MEFRGFMLARRAKDEQLEELWASEEWGAQEKYDGSRYALNEGSLISRHTSVKTGQAVDKTANVPHLVEQLKLILGSTKGNVVDGEIVHSNGWGSSQSAMGSLPDRALEWQQENGFVKYKVFDIILLKGKEVWKYPYKDRHEILQEALDVKHLHLENKYIYVPKLVTKEKLKRELYAKILERGGEGVILKKMDSPYEFDRSKAWIKIKRVDTYDVVVCGYSDAKEWYAEPGTTGHDGILYKDGRKTKFFEKGLIGAIKFGLYDKKTGKVVEVGQCSGMDDETREEISKNKDKCIGRVMEMMANERMPTGGFRHPRFLRWREDKAKEQCLEWLEG